MEIFDFVNYKTFLVERLKKFPGGGRGQARKLALHLGVNSVVISQILKGDRDFTLDQGYEVAEFFTLTELEREYFLLLIQFARASTARYRTHIKNQLQEIKSRSKELKSRVPQAKEFSEEAKAMFYSNWYFIAVSLVTGIKDFRSIETISERLQLPRTLVRKTMDFLLTHRLCVQGKNGFEIGPRITHLESTSQLVNRHHTNWRIKAIEKMQVFDPEELFYTGPMLISQSLQGEIRKRLVQLIQENIKLLKDCPDETLMCLNIDWFKI